jgi:hypothetical protein
VCAIGDLGKDCKEPYHTPDGAPLLTTQAATILPVYRHIAKTVGALKQTFDDQQVALLLARALLGTVIRLNTEEVGIVTQTHPDDPFRPQVKLILDREGNKYETPLLTNT